MTRATAISADLRREPERDAPEAWNDPRQAWAPFRPDARRTWNLRLAAHLYRRATFGATWDQLRRALSDGPARTIDKLMRPDGDLPAFERTYRQYESAASESAQTDGLRAWWLRRMIRTPHPLLEKMTLFWHGHFAVSNANVKNARLMRQHVGQLREFALGSFESMLEGVLRDPALLTGHGAAANRKARPNERFARLLLDRFCLGPGQCDDGDVRDTARALTGAFILRNEFRTIQREHDETVKTVLGQRGNLGRSDVVRIVLAHPATSRWIVRRLYGWLICRTDRPDDALIAPLAESFARDYDTAKLVETMLRSNLFFAPRAYRQCVKSPVDFALGLVTGLEGMVPTTRLGEDLAALGQDLYRPPTAKGWPGGRSWLNAATLVARGNLAAALTAGTEEYGEGLDPATIARKHGHAAGPAAARFLLDLLLGGDVPDEVRDGLLARAEATPAPEDSAAWARRTVHAICTLPEFQLS